jgi:hypothetical protein
MKMIPAARTVRYEQLEPGELFLFVDEGTYALKCRQEQGERNKMVVLGPSFMDGGGPYLLGWQATTVLSFGKEFSIFLPIAPEAWVPQPADLSQVWLTVAENRTFVCVNIGPSPQHPVRGYVDFETGQVFEYIQGSALFADTWEIAVLGANHPPRTILKFPLPEPE